VAVERRGTTFVPEESSPPSVATPVVLLAALLGSFALAALFMIHDHSWTDSLMARLPLPGPSVSLAADPSLASQIRLTHARAWNTLLADQTPVLVAEAWATNDALVPVRRVTVVVEARSDRGSSVTGTVACGVSVSNRLLRRIARDELAALRELEPPMTVEPGQRLPCQIAFAGMAAEAKEVVLRVASVEPFPGHRSPAFRPGE
jgi:hypothetical protein